MAQTTSEEVEPRRILERGTNGLVQGFLMGEIHGFLNPTDGIRASLVVFQFRLLSSKWHQRLKYAAVSIRFADAQGREEFDPDVIHLAPNGAFMLERSTPRETMVATGGIAGGLLGGRAGGSTGGFSFELQKTVERRSRMRLSGRASVEGRNYGPNNAVTWVVTVDSQRENGISCSFYAAILLKRKNDDQFLAKIHLETENAGGSAILSTLGSLLRATSVGSLLRATSGVTDDLIAFNPSVTVRRQLRYDDNELEQINLHDFADIQVLEGPHALNNSPASIERGEKFPLIKIAEGLTREQKLFDFSRGLYPEVWYKFKRFETLSLLNLYNYQDKLVQLDEQINKAGGELSTGDASRLAALLREYRRLFVT
jgi:hypothetical protein